MSRIERAAGTRISHSPDIRVTNPWHAVAVMTPADTCCRASALARKIRYLSSEAPPLPLSGCTQPKQCVCKYKHFPDRRAGPRRVTDSDRYKNALSRPIEARLTITNRRRRGGRRATDLG
ncbi:MAG TPA: hypothetical protein VHZ99_08830 [Steroidobacteraceae bacterium]|jgi:hypothetical protein|nr:hypothetical protein [Steroidobacteraceae bacterium]